VGGKPVLVDFENSVVHRESLVSTGGESVILRRPPSWRTIIGQVLWGENDVAPAQATRLLSALRQQTRDPILLVIGGGGVGSGSKTLYEADRIRRISFDIYRSDLTDFVADAHSIPLPDNSVDAVWIQAVLEHVLMPEQVVAEIYRVLKPGGLVYAETPFMQQVHEGAYDFTRFTESGHRWLFRRFEKLDSGVVHGPGTVLAWAIRYALAGLFRNYRLGDLASIPLFWIRFLDYVVPKHFAIDGASGFFFLGTKSDGTVTPKDAIADYLGAQRRTS
jgi:SAM-dependent methyltransferase